MILGLSDPSTRFASIRSEMPSSRGTEKPQMSASSTPTTLPVAASAAARLTVTELLPTPPLPLAMASTRHDNGTSVSGARSRACQRALSITSVRSSEFISPHAMRTSVTPGWTPMRVSTSRLMSARQWAAADRQLDADRDDTVGIDIDRWHHAERHDVGAELGIDDRAEHGEHVVTTRRCRLPPVASAGYSWDVFYRRPPCNLFLWSIRRRIRRVSATPGTSTC